MNHSCVGNSRPFLDILEVNQADYGYYGERRKDNKNALL